MGKVKICTELVLAVGVGVGDGVVLRLFRLKFHCDLVVEGVSSLAGNFKSIIWF